MASFSTSKGCSDEATSLLIVTQSDKNNQKIQVFDYLSSYNISVSVHEFLHK